jgi:hypothetical protein
MRYFCTNADIGPDVDLTSGTRVLAGVSRLPLIMEYCYWGDTYVYADLAPIFCL